MKIVSKAVGAVVAGAFIVASCGGSAATDTAQDAAPEASVSEAVDNSQDAAPVVNELLNGTVPTVTGSQVELAGFAGKDVLLWVWAPW